MCHKGWRGGEMKFSCVSCGSDKQPTNIVKFNIGPSEVELRFCETCTGNPHTLDDAHVGSVLEKYGFSQTTIDTTTALIRSIVRKSKILRAA